MVKKIWLSNMHRVTSLSLTRQFILSTVIEKTEEICDWLATKYRHSYENDTSIAPFICEESQTPHPSHAPNAPKSWPCLLLVLFCAKNPSLFYLFIAGGGRDGFIHHHHWELKCKKHFLEFELGFPSPFSLKPFSNPLQYMYNMYLNSKPFLIHV